MLRKILFVDDDADILTITKHVFKAEKNFEIRYASSGKEAILFAQEFHPDLILLDVMMPQIDGISTMKILRNTQGTESIPIIFFSAKITPDELDTYRKAGVLGILTKPFDPLTFVQCILNIWDDYQKTAEEKKEK